jgi:hypothetical protein
MLIYFNLRFIYILKLVTEYLVAVDRIYEYSGDPFLDAQTPSGYRN